MSEPHEELDIETLVDRAIKGMAGEWVTLLRAVADLNEVHAGSVGFDDKACADSMRFTALRLRRIADRMERS